MHARTAEVFAGSALQITPACVRAHTAEVFCFAVHCSALQITPTCARAHSRNLFSALHCSALQITPACTRAHSRSLFAAVQRKQCTANHTACACTQPSAGPSSTLVHFCVPTNEILPSAPPADAPLAAVARAVHVSRDAHTQRRLRLPASPS